MLVGLGTTTATALSARATERWWWGGGEGLFWLIMLIYMVNRGYGRTLLTPNGMEFHTFVSRRSIPWGEIARVEKRCRQTRSGTWWDVRAIRVHGRALTIPGAFTSKHADAKFEEEMAKIREYWFHAVAR